MALEGIELVESLPKNQTTEVIGRQLIRSACSVAANYRAACRARSRADFVDKLGVVEEETDETMFWLEMLVDSGQASSDNVMRVANETRELLAIFSASRITARRNRT